LQVTAGTEETQISKSWLFRFKLNGKERRMRLGSLHKVSLADARKEADRCRKLVHEGRDPIEIRDAQREAQKVAETTSKTFKAWATTYMAEHERNWRNSKHRDQWRNTLRDYAHPVIGSDRVRMTSHHPPASLKTRGDEFSSGAARVAAGPG
jgi:hypothetical protein